VSLPAPSPQAHDDGKPPLRVGARLIAAALGLFVVGIDQLTKSWALASLRDGPIDLFWTLRLRLTFNTGAAFSLGSGFPWLFAGLGVVVLAALAVLVLRSDISRGPAAGLGLIAGGAVGNLVDRLLRDHDGAVVDFVDLQWWPVFNVADASISVGVIVLLLTWRDTAGKPSADVPAAEPATETGA